MRHKRRAALKSADLVILAGVPADFRMDYGRVINRKARVIAVNLAVGTLFKNPLPTLPVPADPGRFLIGLAARCPSPRPEWSDWRRELAARDAAGFSLVEFDTFARHGLPVIAVIGNDAAWTQIARDQVTLLGDDVATNLARTDYDQVAVGLGAVGLVIKDESEINSVLARARKEAAAGRPVLVNAHIGTTRFRDGSISV